jgi:hypothetical protein
MADQKLTARGSFRRLRTQFKKSLGLENLTPADRVLIDQAALLALRAREMREAILAGDKVVSDEDLVRTTNACIRTMTAIDIATHGRGDRFLKSTVANPTECRSAVCAKSQSSRLLTMIISFANP